MTTVATDPAAVPDLVPDADDLVAQAALLPRRAAVAHHMAMPWSIHVRGPAAHDPATEHVVAAAFEVVGRIDRELSPFRSGSALNAYRDGTLTLADGPASLRAVHLLCQEALDVTDGVFDAWGWRDGFDPTGLTKGWAIAETMSALAGLDGDVAVVAGGDIAVRSVTGLPWRVGIEDPADRTRVLARVDVVEGAVATSGVAARGAHIVRRGAWDAQNDGPAVTSATVVADAIVWADVWATTAVALGPGARTGLRRAHGTTGLLAHEDGSILRWSAT